MSFKIIITTLLISLLSILQAQEPSAIVEYESTTQGMLTPRMTETQRTNISNPATGLLVYQTDQQSGFWYYNGVEWVSLFLSQQENKILFGRPFLSYQSNELDKVIASDGGQLDFFGENVAISGDYAIIAADNTNIQEGNSSYNRAGSAYIFKNNGTAWIEHTKLTASDIDDFVQFGTSVAIHTDYAIVGSVFDDDNGTQSGAAYIFRRTGSTWIQEAKLTASDSDESDLFGASVSIFGEYAIVGANGTDDDTGSAYIFKRSGTSWAEQIKLTASDANVGDFFGLDVSIYGDHVVVGASLNDDNGSFSGCAYIFERSNDTWSEITKLTASDADEGDRFGISVSIDESNIIIGASGDSDSGLRTGSAYLFERTGNTWVENSKLTAADKDAEDSFGRSVSISGDRAIVGASGDDDGGSSSGSAYIFVRFGNSWLQETKLTASNADIFDSFGRSVAISGTHVLVGTGTTEIVYVY